MKALEMHLTRTIKSAEKLGETQLAIQLRRLLNDYKDKSGVRITATVILPGDHSVTGIDDVQIEMDFGKYDSYESFFDGERETHRKTIQKFADETGLADCGKSHVMFGDETDAGLDEGDGE